MLSAFILTRRRYSAMPLAGQPIHGRSVLPGPLVLRKSLLKFQRPQRIGDRTVSRRSEPSSRTTLIGEQPNPWQLLHRQDVTSRHRGAEQRRRYGRLGATSLFVLFSSLSFLKALTIYSSRFLSGVRRIILGFNQNLELYCCIVSRSQSIRGHSDMVSEDFPRYYSFAFDVCEESFTVISRILFPFVTE